MPKRVFRSMINAAIITLCLLVTVFYLVSLQNKHDVNLAFRAFDRQALALNAEIPHYYLNPRQRYHLDKRLTAEKMRLLSDRTNNLTIGYSILRKDKVDAEVLANTKLHVANVNEKYHLLNQKYTAQTRLNNYYQNADLLHEDRVNPGAYLKDTIDMNRLRAFGNSYLAVIKKNDPWKKDMTRLYKQTFRQAAHINAVEIAVNDLFAENDMVDEGTTRKEYTRVKLDVMRFKNPTTQNRLTKRLDIVFEALKDFDPLLQDLTEETLSNRILYLYLKKVMPDTAFASIENAMPWYIVNLNLEEEAPYTGAIYAYREEHVVMVAYFNYSQDGTIHYSTSQEAYNLLNHVSYQNLKGIGDTRTDSVDEISERINELASAAVTESEFRTVNGDTVIMPHAGALVEQSLSTTSGKLNHGQESHYSVLTLLSNRRAVLYQVEFREGQIVESYIQGNLMIADGQKTSDTDLDLQEELKSIDYEQIDLSTSRIYQNVYAGLSTFESRQPLYSNGQGTGVNYIDQNPSQLILPSQLIINRTGGQVESMAIVEDGGAASFEMNIKPSNDFLQMSVDTMNTFGIN